LCDAYADKLLERWESDNISVSGALDALETMGATPWFYANGGQPIYRKTLDKVLSHLHMAAAYDWGGLLNFPSVAIDWTSEDEAKLTDALADYRTEGVGYDREACSNVSDLAELRSSLADLSARFGIDFSSAISSIEDEIAEREQRESDYESGGFSGRPLPEAEEVGTDDDVRQMFQTLRG